MKRWQNVALLTGIILAATWVVLPAATYTYVVRELSQTMTGMFTFGAGATISAVGLNVDGGDINMANGQRVMMEDSSGDSYLIWDASSHQVQVYVDGELHGRITPHGVIPGDCPDDLYSMEVGTQCFASDGRSIVVGPNGPQVITGSLP